MSIRNAHLVFACCCMILWFSFAAFLVWERHWIIGVAIGVVAMYGVKVKA